jgi:excisionase family DNA binding protein
MTLMTIKEAAASRRVSERTIRRWIAIGVLPAMRVGPTAIRVDVADLDSITRRIPTASRTA